jgi:rod shape-determining protein MreC
LILILVIVLSVTLMLLSSNEKDRFARSVNDVAMTPVQVVVAKGRGLLGQRAVNDSLRTELARTSLALMRAKESARENDRLRSLLDFREGNRLEVLATRVIAREATHLGGQFKIDKGFQDGVRKDLSVITAAGLVGKVTTVHLRSAFVRPLLVDRCSVSVKLARTRTDGILEWTSDLGLHLKFLPFRAEVAPGDDIVTSGMGGVFPKGLLVGNVAHVEKVADGSLQVLVNPVVDFSSIDEVFVVLEVRDDKSEEEGSNDASGAVAIPGNRVESQQT